MLVAFAASCSSGPTDASGASDGGAAGVLVFASAFKDFHSWDSTPGVGPPDAAADLIAAVDGGPHSLGPMTSYISKKPPPGSTSFPDGTIIVKEVNGGDLTTRKIFAMEKRGGDIDQDGAVGWEWFELEEGANGISIRWHGVGPPAGGDPRRAWRRLAHVPAIGAAGGAVFLQAGG